MCGRVEQLRTRLIDYKARGGSFRVLADLAGVSEAALSRNAAGKQPCDPDSPTDARIEAALDHAPVGRRPSQRLRTRLDKAQAIQDARDPYWASARAAHQFTIDRPTMTPTERAAAYAELG